MTDPQNSVTNNLVAEFIYTYRASLEICPLAKEIEMSSDTPTVQEIDAATAKAWLDAGDAVLIDVREQPELNEASIPVAEHNPMSSFDFDKVPRDGSKKVVIMCAHGMRLSTLSKTYPRRVRLNPRADSLSTAPTPPGWASSRS